MVSSIKEYLIYFIVGGTVTSLIVGLENSDHRLLSGLATLVPVFTVVSYLFIGEMRGGQAVSSHAWLVLVGSLVAWVPYMLIVAYLAPKVGPQKAIASGLGAFFLLAVVYLEVVGYFGLFRR